MRETLQRWETPGLSQLAAKRLPVSDTFSEQQLSPTSGVLNMRKYPLLEH